MSRLVAIFLVLVQGITCRTPHRKQLWNNCSLILLLWETVSEAELSVTAFEAQVPPISSLMTHFIWSPFLPAVLACFGMAVLSSPQGIRNPPNLLLCLCPRAAIAWVEAVQCTRTGLLPAVGKPLLKCPRFCSWPLAYVFIKMLFFSLFYKISCLPVNINVLVI